MCLTMNFWSLWTGNVWGWRVVNSGWGWRSLDYLVASPDQDKSKENEWQNQFQWAIFSPTSTSTKYNMATQVISYKFEWESKWHNEFRNSAYYPSDSTVTFGHPEPSCSLIANQLWSSADLRIQLASPPNVIICSNDVVMVVQWLALISHRSSVPGSTLGLRLPSTLTFLCHPHGLLFGFSSILKNVGASRWLDSRG